jgi:Ca-activated chloride channel family protein
MKESGIGREGPRFAVEEMTVTVGGEPVKIAVPVEMPEGVSYEGVFGFGEGAGWAMPAYSGPSSARQARVSAGGRPATPAMAPRAPSPAGGIGGGGTSGNALAHGAAKPERRAREMAEDLADGAASQPALTTQEIVRAKLAEPLRDLAAKVEKEGQDGTLAIGKLKVAAWRVDVMVFLSDASEKTLEALKKLGFEQTGESKAVKLLVGTIDVRKLEELAVLDAVLSVKPVVSP